MVAAKKGRVTVSDLKVILWVRPMQLVDTVHPSKAGVKWTIIFLLFSVYFYFYFRIFVFFPPASGAVRARIPSGWQLQYLMLRRKSLLRV